MLMQLIFGEVCSLSAKHLKRADIVKPMMNIVWEDMLLKIYKDSS